MLVVRVPEHAVDLTGALAPAGEARSLLLAPWLELCSECREALEEAADVCEIEQIWDAVD
jgi:hypothetical protein